MMIQISSTRNQKIFLEMIKSKTSGIDTFNEDYFLSDTKKLLSGKYDIDMTRKNMRIMVKI